MDAAGARGGPEAWFSVTALASVPEMVLGSFHFFIFLGLFPSGLKPDVSWFESSETLREQSPGAALPSGDSERYLGTSVVVTTGRAGIEWVGPGMLLGTPQCPGRPPQR